MNTCPCCAEVLLRHARHSGVYWFCTHCWQEMPDLSLETVSLYRDQPQQPELMSGLMALPVPQ